MISLSSAAAAAIAGSVSAFAVNVYRARSGGSKADEKAGKPSAPSSSSTDYHLMIPSHAPPASPRRQLASELQWELSSVGLHTVQHLLVILNVAACIGAELWFLHLAYSKDAGGPMLGWTAGTLVVLAWATIVGEFVAPDAPYLLCLPISMPLVAAPATALNVYLTLLSPAGARLAAALPWSLLLAASAHAIAIDIPLVLGNRLGNLPGHLLPPTEACNVELWLCGRVFHLRRGLHLDGLLKGSLGPALALWAAYAGEDALPRPLLGAFTVLAACTSLQVPAMVALSFPTPLQIFSNDPAPLPFISFPGYWIAPVAAQFGLLLAGVQARKLAEGWS